MEPEAHYTTTPLHSHNFKAPEEPNKKAPKENGITVLSMAFFVLFAISIVIYLYYQNQQLKKIITDQISTQATLQPAPTQIPDPFSGWIAYSDSGAGFSFKHPVDWTKPADLGLFNDPSGNFNFDVKTYESNLTLEKWKRSKCTVGGIDFCSESVAGPIQGSIQYNHPKSQYDSLDTIVKNGNKILLISLSSREANKSADEDLKSLYNQIVSSFRFFVAETPAIPIPAGSNIP